MGQAASSDAGLQASLENFKRANSAYLNNQNSRTARDFTAAMDGHSAALADAGMPGQARDVRKAKMHFQKKPGSRPNIAVKMAGTLVDMTVKELHKWSLREVLDGFRDDEGDDADDRGFGGFGDDEEDVPDPDDGEEDEGGGWGIFDMLSAVFGGEEE